MKGGFLHNLVLLPPFERHFRSLGAQVFAEHSVELGRSPRSVDLFVLLGQSRIVIEAELTPRRVVADVEKALMLDATLLLVVMPTRGAASAAERSLTLAQSGGLSSTVIDLWILPLGPAMQRVQSSFPLSINPIHPQKSNRKAGHHGAGTYGEE